MKREKQPCEHEGQKRRKGGGVTGVCRKVRARAYIHTAAHGEPHAGAGGCALKEL